MARPKKEQSDANYVVLKPFRDSAAYIENGVINRWEEGVDVSHFDAQRLEALEKRGLVKNNGSTEKEEE